MTRNLSMSLLLFLIAACGELAETDTDADLVDAGVSLLAAPGGGGGGPPPPPLCLPPSGAVIDHVGTITTAQTWGGRNIHTVSADLQIAAAVSIAPCTHVRIAAGKTITIQQNGSLVAQANGAGGPGGEVIERRDAGAWARIRVLAGGSLALNGANVDGGGAVTAAITLEGGTLSVQNASITNSASYGLVATSTATTNPITGSGLTISGSASAPVFMIAYVAGSLPLGTYTGNHDNELEISALPSSAYANFVTANATWHNQGVPYHITGSGNYIDVESLTGGVASLTIEPGTTLRFDNNIQMFVDKAAGKTTAPSGTLVALGTADQPIVFTSSAEPPARGDWVGLYFGGKLTSAQVGHTQLDHAVVAFAGGDTTSSYGSCHFPTTAPHNNAAIRVMGEEPDYVFVTNTMIASSKLHGIDRGWIPASSTTTTDFLAPVSGNSFVDLLNPGVDSCAETMPPDQHNSCSMRTRCGP